MAHELGMQQRRCRFDIGTKRIVAGKVALVLTQVEVVHMHMFPRRDGLAGKADDLVVATHGLTCGDGAGGDFVARRNQATHSDVFHGRTAHELLAGDDDVVVRVQSNVWVHGMQRGIRKTTSLAAATEKWPAHK